MTRVTSNGNKRVRLMYAQVSVRIILSPDVAYWRFDDSPPTPITGVGDWLRSGHVRSRSFAAISGHLYESVGGIVFRRTLQQDVNNHIHYDTEAHNICRWNSHNDTTKPNSMLNVGKYSLNVWIRFIYKTNDRTRGSGKTAMSVKTNTKSIV